MLTSVPAMVAQLAPPPSEPRPKRFDASVLARAVQPCVTPLVEALANTLPKKHLDGEQIGAAVAIAIERAIGEPWRAARVLEEHFKWPVDLTLAKIVGQACNNIPYAWAAECGLWCLRTGYKFPAHCEDTVEWIDPEGRMRAGKVVTLDRPHAAAIVQLIVAGQEQVEHFRVHAENVYANVTRGLWNMNDGETFEVPPVDKAPAPKRVTL